MVRIKTITSAGREFLSPLIYTESSGMTIINRIKKWHKKPDYELEYIPFDECPEDCFCDQTHELDIMLYDIDRAERIWEK